MKFKRKIFLEKGNLDMVPLIDIVFLLLIFFMLTSSFVFQPGIRVNLPKAVTSEVLNRDIVVIVVTDDEHVYINERPVTSEELISIITSLTGKNSSLLIKADKNAPLGKIIDIWDICRQRGIKQVNIATTQ
ncbi:biopolymer transport protein ExbD/TolR [Candidatus Omnitrophus magneticus]|uniref:Biopolymer transport protein ExbD/TolR n=1 Tax=Candidatus Omnitrophus magneticus TaxID=1609969 RepID=A0A0F0CMS9_9BACT|nr:biopolymer transport protein ExbD/TolR [Candidatus Omnitrophus magneticus]